MLGYLCATVQILASSTRLSKPKFPNTCHLTGTRISKPYFQKKASSSVPGYLSLTFQKPSISTVPDCISSTSQISASQTVPGYQRLPKDHAPRQSQYIWAYLSKTQAVHSTRTSKRYFSKISQPNNTGMSRISFPNKSANPTVPGYPYEPNFPNIGQLKRNRISKPNCPKNMPVQRYHDIQASLSENQPAQHTTQNTFSHVNTKSHNPKPTVSRS